MNKIEMLYKYLEDIAKEQYIANLLSWDLRVNAPLDTKEYLIEVKTDVELKIFEMETSSKYEELLKDAINSKEFNQISELEKRYLKELLHKYEINKKVPSAFYEEYAKTCSTVNTIWETAKENNDYNMFKPYLKKIIDMTKEYYTYKYPDMDLYDSMLNEYEEGMTSQVIDKLFKEIKDALIPLVNQYQDSIKPYTKESSSSELLDTAKYLLNYIGFDMNKGALGIYPHGYTEKMSYNDVRIAFKHGNKPCDFVSTIIHEGGHGIFEQNINPTISHLRNACIDGLYGLHESQSRFYENILGRNPNFWIPIYDEVKKLLHLDLSFDDFVKQLNNVHKGYIRTEADELTYCLHIIIRYEIERDIFNNNLDVDDLPKVWNQKMKEYLGLDVPNDSMGVMQDVHWSEGSFGYFPSYLLGNIYDGIFIKCIERDLGNIDEILRSGKIKEITNYLIKNIYVNGGVYISREVLHNMGIDEISAKPLIEYFYNKYDKKGV